MTSSTSSKSSHPPSNPDEQDVTYSRPAEGLPLGWLLHYVGFRHRVGEAPKRWYCALYNPQGECISVGKICSAIEDAAASALPPPESKAGADWDPSIDLRALVRRGDMDALLDPALPAILETELTSAWWIEGSRRCLRKVGRFLKEEDRINYPRRFRSQLRSCAALRRQLESVPAHIDAALTILSKYGPKDPSRKGKAKRKPKPVPHHQGSKYALGQPLASPFV